MALLVGSTVIEHLAQPAIGHSVLGAAGELVEHLLLVNDENAEIVIILMQGGHTARLLQIGAGRHDNHIGNRLAMDILVGHISLKNGIQETAGLVESDKLTAAALGGAKGKRTLATLAIELHRGKRLSDVPHTRVASATGQTITA